MRVGYAVGGIAAAALIALPANASAGQGGGLLQDLTAQQCRQERANVGRKAFRKKYGAKRTMRSCAKRTMPAVASAIGTASSDCQDELAQVGPADFTDEYSDDPTDLSGAMDECVAEDVDQILNPDDSVDDPADGADS